MTKDEAVAKLQAIPKGDPEAAHGDADGVLLEFLRTNNNKEIADAWNDVATRNGGFWYA